MPTKQNTEPDPLVEVLTRKPNGHETVHRFRATDEAAARAAVVEAGVPHAQIVEATQVG
jgi:hypothetical protein